MEETEAIAMVQTLASRADNVQARGLAVALGNRPLLIEYACEFLTRNPSIGIADLSRILAFSPSVALDAIAPRSVDTLTLIYRELVNRLERTHPLSVRLLSLLAFISPHFAPKEYLGAFLLGKPYLTAADTTLAGVQLDAALRPLIENCLVQSLPGMIITPPLVQAILRDLLRDRLESVAESASRLEASREELYGEGWTLFTVIGRILCHGVLQARVRDQRMGKSRVIHQVDFGDAYWDLLITAAGGRIMLVEIDYICDMHRGSLAFKALIAEKHEEVRSTVKHAPQLLREEAEQAMLVIRALNESITRDRTDRPDDPSTSNPETAEGTEELTAYLGERYVDSPYGQLDLSIFLPIGGVKERSIDPPS